MSENEIFELYLGGYHPEDLVERLLRNDDATCVSHAHTIIQNAVTNRVNSLINSMVEIRGLVRPIIQNAPTILEEATQEQIDNE